MLRRYQPISRAAQWSERGQYIDPRTRLPNNLADAVLTLGLYQRRYGGGFRCDYGRAIPGWGAPVLTATTQADGSGPFVILPDQITYAWTFPSGSLLCLWPGDLMLIVWATINGQTDEVQRDTIRVLEGPDAVPGQAASVAPSPTPDNSIIADGGRI